MPCNTGKHAQLRQVHLQVLDAPNKPALLNLLQLEYMIVYRIQVKCVVEHNALQDAVQNFTSNNKKTSGIPCQNWRQFYFNKARCIGYFQSKSTYKIYYNVYRQWILKLQSSISYQSHIVYQKSPHFGIEFLLAMQTTSKTN